VAELSDPSRVTAEGRGENEPIADNGTPDGRRKNRRIELIVLKVDDELGAALTGVTTQ
jgi:type VI secretion system protein ImpK